MSSLTISLENLSEKKREMVVGFLAELLEVGQETSDTPLPPDPRGAFTETPAPPPPAAAPAMNAAPSPVNTPGIATGIALVIPAEVPPPPPAAVLAPPAPGGSSVVLDASGLPWDARIHATAKTKNANGTWKYKRGADPILIKKVERELDRMMNLPGPKLVDAPPAGAAVPPPPSAAPAVPPPPSPGATREDYVALFRKVSDAVAEARITDDQLTKVLSSMGVPSIMLLATRLDLVPQAAQLIEAVIAGASA